jgi:phage anti-repressor protein
MANTIQYENQLAAIIRSTDQYPVDFNQAWQWVGYARKDHALVVLKNNFEEVQDFSRIFGKSTGGRPAEIFMLTVDCFKAFCMMAGTEKGKEVRRYYLELEKKFEELKRLDIAGEQYGGLAWEVEQMKEYRLAHESGAIDLQEWRKFLLTLLPAKRSPAKPWEEKIQEADDFIRRHIEYTGCRSDWIKTIELYCYYKQEIQNGIPKYEFSRRIAKSGATWFRRNNIEAFSGIKYHMVPMGEAVNG